MKLLSERDAVRLMNQYGKEGVPFIFVCSYDKTRCIVLPIAEINPEELLFSFNGHSNDEGMSHEVDTPIMTADYPSFAEYKRGFDIVQQHITDGNSSLVNYTCSVPIDINLSLNDIYHGSSALFKLWIKNMLVCFSPEIFVRINKKGEISSYPMKGTIDATLPDAERLLMDNEKEIREHADVVKLITNDLSLVAKDVHTKRYRYIDKIKTSKGCILETSSEVCGTLPDDYCQHIGDILFSQLPAGSITGAPKNKTVRIIDEAENYYRDFYTGVMGWFADGVMESGVMIRFIDEHNGRKFFKAGGGITALSDCHREYEEVKEKVYVPIR